MNSVYEITYENGESVFVIGRSGVSIRILIQTLKSMLPFKYILHANGIEYQKNEIAPVLLNCFSMKTLLQINSTCSDFYEKIPIPSELCRIIHSFLSPI